MSLRSPQSSIAPVRVLQVLEVIDGGVKRHVMSILAAIDRARFEVEVAGPASRPETGEGAAFVADVLALGVPFHRIEMRRAVSPLRDFSALLRLSALIRRRRYDVVHGHSSKAGFLARVAGRLTRTPAVYTPNALYFANMPPGRRRTAYLAFERLAGPFTTRFVAVSESEREIVLREKLVPPEKIELIPNGVEQEAFDRPAHARAHVRAELGIPLDAVVVGTVARLTPQKDPECLVRAVAEVRSGVKRPVYLMLAGDGELRADVERLVRELGMESDCRLLGFRRDARAVMCAFDVFALTSRYEGLPYAVLEAMALGLPVVATDVVGTRDVVDHGVTGYLARVGDAKAVADVLLPLIRDDALRATIGERARRMVTERFTLAKMVARLEELYARIARRSSGRPVGRAALRREALSR